MADKTIRENFFDAKAIGSLWDVAVSLKRGNPLPIDADSVFESEAKLIEYIGDKITTVAYPGQVVAVVNADSTQIFYIDQELNYHPVGAKLDADGKSIKVDNNVLKLVGFDEAADGLLAQVKVDAEGNRTLNWVSIETIAQGDGNTTYTFTGLDKESNLSFTVKASDVEEATTIYLDAYTKKEVDNIVGKASTETEAATGLHKVIEDAKAAAIEEATYDDTALSGRVKTLEDAGYQNASQVGTAITNALNDYYTKTSIDETVEELEGKISAIPKFAIEVANAKEDGTPDVETPSYTTVYLVPDNDESTTDVYDEYIYVHISDEESKWELLGKQTLDLTGYATETFVTDEIAKLSAEGGAIKTVADELDTLEGLHNQLVDDVELIEQDVTNLKAIDHQKIAEDAANNAITTHETNKSHLTSDDVDSQIDAKLTTANYDTKISTAKQEAIDEATEAIPVKTVSGEFTLTEGNLEVKEISQDKITGLADVFAGIYTKEEIDTKIGNKPTKTVDEETGKNVYSGATGLYVDIYTKDEVTDLIASFTGGESAADVLAELNKYKTSNDAALKEVTDDIAEIFEALDTKLEGVTIDGVALAPVDKIVDIPAATSDKFGVVKLGSEFQTNAETKVLEVKELNVNKLVQTDGDTLILNGGLASDLK